VAGALADMARSGLLAADALATSYRVFLGVGAAALIGIPLGVLMGWSARISNLCEVVFHVARSIPPIAWVPFALLWFRGSLASAAFVVFLGAFFPIALNAASGVRSVERLYLEVAWNMGASDSQILSRVVLPASSPAILTGVRVGFGVGWMTVVAAEFMGQGSGLGARMIESYNLLRMDRMMVAMLAVGAAGLTTDLVLRLSSRTLFLWANAGSPRSETIEHYRLQVPAALGVAPGVSPAESSQAGGAGQGRAQDCRPQPARLSTRWR
jgi:ABC-type nitrate/sulfonate/bicarbonate transport system permease component